MQVSRYQDVLGRLLDGDAKLLRILGNIETDWLEERLEEVAIKQPVYITGLARSGTTILLELLGTHPDVATHCYRDFPLVHIPVWWNWFLNRAASRDDASVERAHKDGIYITAKSPEAMEEIIWMSFFSECHNPAVSNVIRSADGSEEFEKFYRAHIRKVLLIRNGNRYLAKGNYNLTRLEYLHALFPDALFLIPVRDPVGHVASLHKQHRMFCEAERQDVRVLNYMRRSGHFEFGLDRRAINLGETATAGRIGDLWNEGQEIRGLAALWSSIYSYLAELVTQNRSLARRTLFVHYQDLCNSPGEMLDRIYAHCALEVDRQELAAQAARIAAPEYYRHGFSEAELAVIDEETRDARSKMERLRTG